MSSPSDILVIEDDQGTAYMLIERVRRLWGDTMFHQADSLAAAQQILRVLAPDIILLDLYLPDTQGIETIDRVIVSSPQSIVIAISGYLTDIDGLVCLGHGADAYILKSAPETIVLTMAQCWQRAIGRNQRLLPLQQRTPHVVAAPLPVLK